MTRQVGLHLIGLLVFRYRPIYNSL